MTRTVHDYEALELEYIQSDITVRELCRKHDIRVWSSVNAQKNKRGWDRKRADYKAGVAARQIDTLVGTRMLTIATIHDELLLAIRAAVHRYIKRVQEPEDGQDVSARDLMGLIDKFLLLTGQATSRSESKNLDLVAHDFGGLLAGAPSELLRELAELAGERGAGSQPVGRGPLIVLEGTRSA